MCSTPLVGFSTVVYQASLYLSFLFLVNLCIEKKKKKKIKAFAERVEISSTFLTQRKTLRTLCKGSFPLGEFLRANRFLLGNYNYCAIKMLTMQFAAAKKSRIDFYFLPAKKGASQSHFRNLCT